MNTQIVTGLQALATVTVSERARKLVWGEPEPRELVSLSLSDLGIAVEQGSIGKEPVMQRIRELNLKPCRLEAAIQLWLDLHNEEFRNKILEGDKVASLFIFTDPTQDCTSDTGPTLAVRIDFHEVHEYSTQRLSLMFYRGLEALTEGAFYPQWKYVFAK